MPTARRLVASRCPECSAPVDLKQVPIGIEQIRCAYCGTPLLLPKRQQEAGSPTAYRPPVTPPQGSREAFSGTFSVTRGATGTTLRARPVVTQTTKSSKSRTGCGIILSTIVLIVMIASDVGVFQRLESAWAAARGAGDSSDSEIGFLPADLLSGDFFGNLGWNLAMPVMVGHLYGRPVAAAGSQTEQVTDVLIQGRDSNDQGILYNMDPETKSLRWRAGPYSRNFLELAVAVGPRYVYVADQGRLHALDRASGEQVWQVSLANNIPHPCEGCLQYMAGYVVALTRDGTLQSFDGNSGLPAWNRRLRTTPRKLHSVGGQPAVVDGDERNRAVFYMLDRITGSELQVIQPVCQNNGHDQYPSPGGEFVVSGDWLRLHVLGTGGAPCLWRYSLLTGELEWLHHDQRDARVLASSWINESYLIRGGVFYSTQRESGAGVLRAVDSQTNVVRELFRAPQYELKLHTLHGDTLILEATPNFARNEPEIWGINIATGEQRWRIQLDMRHPFDTLLVYDTEAGIFLGQCLWEEDACVFEILDPHSSLSRGAVRIATRGSVNGVTELGGMLWLNIWGKLHGVDLRTAEVKVIWP